MVMGDRPEVERSAAPEAALDLLGLAAQMGVALSRVPLKRPWRGPATVPANMAASLTREVIRSFMGYSTGLRIEEFRSIELVLDRLSSVAMPPFIAAYGVSHESTTVGGVPGIWYRPKGDDDEPRRTIAYFHGGGYIGTSPWMYGAFTAAIAHRTGCNVFVADYRLAPEFPYPSGVEDGLEVLGALVDSGIPANDIFLAGDSGGGGLVCSLMEHMEFFETDELAGVILFSPEVDLVLDQPSVTDNAGNDILPWNIPTSAYLHGDGTFVSPLTQDVSKWPPTYIVYGEDEMFRDPIRQFIAHLEEGGVEVEAIEAPGMFHVFPILMPWAPPSHEAFNDLERFTAEAEAAAARRR